MSFTVNFSCPTEEVNMQCGSFLKKETFPYMVKSGYIYGYGAGLPSFTVDPTSAFFYSTLIGDCSVCVVPKKVLPLPGPIPFPGPEDPEEPPPP